MDNDVLINSLLNATSLEALKNQLVPCLQTIGVPYKRLSFNLTQSGTDAPVITPDQNEVGITLTTSYDAAGDYVLSFGRTVDATKVRIFGGLLQNVGLCFARCTSTTLNIQTNDTAGSPVDDILANTSFELRFYPGWDA